MLVDHFCEDLGCYPHGELRDQEGTDSGKGVQPELRGLGYYDRLSWVDGCLPCPLCSGPSHSWEDLDRIEFGWRPRVGFGLNLGVWTPFSSPCHSGKIISSFILLQNEHNHNDILQRVHGRLIAVCGMFEAMLRCFAIPGLTWC